jgi:hypothetical protein
VRGDLPTPGEVWRFQSCLVMFVHWACNAGAGSDDAGAVMRAGFALALSHVLFSPVEKRWGKRISRSSGRNAGFCGKQDFEAAKLADT